MARGQRSDRADEARPRGVRFVQTAVVRANWRDLHDFDQALVLVPEASPTNSDPDRVLLRCWRAERIAGGWEPTEEMGVTRMNREPDGSWRPIGPL